MIASGLVGLVALVGVLFRILNVTEERLAKNNAQPIAEVEESRVDIIVAGSRGDYARRARRFERRGVLRLLPVHRGVSEISLARASLAANSGDKEHALFWLPVWEVEQAFRDRDVPEARELRRYQSMQGYLIRKKLELLEHELEHDPYEPDEVRKVIGKLFGTNRRWVESFR